MMKCNINILVPCIVAIAGILWSYYNPTMNTSYTLWRIQNKDIIHALSAAIGSAVSITLLYPLETIRTRMQVDTSDSTRSRGLVYTIIGIFRKEGLAQGIYKGWFSLVVALWSLNFVYFYFFHSLRRWVENLDTSSFNNQTVIDLLVGYGAGVIAVLFTGPLWLGESVYLMYWHMLCL